MMWHMRRGVATAGLLLAAWVALPCTGLAGTVVRISDLNYVRRTYYFISDHQSSIDLSSLRVFRDDRNPTNDRTYPALPGVARLDPRSPASASNPEFQGRFDLLTIGADYNIIDLHPPLGDGSDLPVLEFTTPLSQNDVLGVAYREHVGDHDEEVGNSDLSVTDSLLEKYPGQVLLKALKADPGMPGRTYDGAYDRSDPWYPVLEFELRNVYSLGMQNLDLSRTTIDVRYRDSAYVTDPDQFHGQTFINLLGLDQAGPTPGSPPDGVVDSAFLDVHRGLLFFPDLHPFAPETTSTSCQPGWGGFLCLDNLARNPLRSCHYYSPDCIANPYVYEWKTPDPLTQSRFYIEVIVAPLPTEQLLHPNHPNPFREWTMIDFETPHAGDVQLDVFDVGGRLVREYRFPQLAAGPHSVQWWGGNARGFAVPSGVYVCRLAGPGFVRTRRIVLMR